MGERAGLLGNEAGNFEAWVYPLKILRDFHLRFLVDGHVVPAEALARTLTVRPECSTILYSGDTFSVRETFFVPVREPGAVIIIEVETASPLDVQVEFERDFQLEWPAALGGTYGHWDPAMNAFFFGEEQKKFSAFVGSPTAGEVHEEYDTNYSSAKESSFHLGAISKGKETRVVVIAGSVHGQAEAEAAYHRLESNYVALLKESADYYRAYLDSTVSVELPDRQLQQSYDWARVSVLQGLVNNPYLGTGLIAGYRTSGGSQRPGFAWFFGRDSLWTALALDAEGDFGTTRTALDFLSKYQRADGKVPHEISQGANFVPWFTDYPYPYASADATPLYIIAMNDYVVASGDAAFAQQKWDSLWKAYQFLLSTYDAQGLPQNFGIGHGWVEGGPLLPVHTELYQSALGAEALRALSSLAHLTGKEDVGRKLSEDFSRQQALVNKTFWSSEKNRFAFALDQKNQQVDEPSVLATVPMWFGLLDEDKAGTMIAELAAPEHQADWGMRIISSRAAKYSAGGYHFGSVWPLFTGWASVGEYRYHRALARLFQSHGQCSTSARRIAGPRHRGAVGRLLSAAVHQFSAPDMVRGHGYQPAAARTFWFADRCRCAPGHAGAARPGELGPVRAGQCARGPVRFAAGLPKERQRNFAGCDPERQRRLQSGIFSRSQPAGADSRRGDERQESTVPGEEERCGPARQRAISPRQWRQHVTPSHQRRFRLEHLTGFASLGKRQPGFARVVRIMDAGARQSYP